jgi:hypothetical protein
VHKNILQNVVKTAKNFYLKSLKTKNIVIELRQRELENQINLKNTVSFLTNGAKFPHL